MEKVCIDYIKLNREISNTEHSGIFNKYYNEALKLFFLIYWILLILCMMMKVFIILIMMVFNIMFIYLIYVF